MNMCPWDFLPNQNYLYCERILCGWVEQPANTWSNIGYLMAAILVLRSLKPKTEKIFFFWASFILFLGSTFFHMSGTHLGKLLDVGAMLILSMGICALSLQRWFAWDKRKTYITYALGLGVSLLFLFVMGFGNIPFGIEILISAILEFLMIKKNRGFLEKKTLCLAIGIEFLAAVFLVLDLTKTWCDPDNHFINGHAVWHLLSAGAIYTLYLSRKSEA